jgi:hypothetical protein
MKTVKIEIEVPESWIDHEGATAFVIALQEWLERHTPCPDCGGSGFRVVNQTHNPEGDTEIGCDTCEMRPWENPLLD